MNQSNGALLVKETETGALSQTDIATLAKAGIIPANTPFDQVMVFAKICRERGLSPFSKEIYLVEYGGKFSTIVGINGFRRLACDTGQFAGCDDAKFDLKSDGTFKTAAELSMQGILPTSCTVTVYRLLAGQRVPFTHTALFREFSSGKQKWVSMPFQMLEKVAEAFALRKGFSDRLSGLNIPEEQVAMEDGQAQVLPTKIGETKEDILNRIKEAVQNIETRQDLEAYYRKHPHWQKDDEITQIFIDYSTKKGWMPNS